MASSIDIIRTIQANILAGIQAAGLQTPGEVVIGWPTADEMAGIIGAGSALISIFPQKASLDTKFRPVPGYLRNPVPSTLVATVVQGSSWTVTFSGANQSGLNIHTVVGPVGNGRLDTLYQNTGTETLAQIATAIAVKVNALSLPSIVATAVGPVVTITGPYPVQCNVGIIVSAVQTPGYYPIFVSEIGRFTRDILVTIWSPQPDAYTNENTIANLDSNRETVEAAVLTSIGGSDLLYVTAPDGSAFRAEWRSTGDWDDQAQSSYSVYKSMQYLTINYPLFRPIAAAQIGAINFTTTIKTQTGQSIAYPQVIG